MKLLRTLSFGFVSLLILSMVIATALEKLYGTNFVVQHIYGSPLFVVGWGAATILSIIYLWCRKVQKRPLIFFLHLSFIVILTGAFITHMYGLQGSVHLRQDADKAAETFSTTNGPIKQFPFKLYLKKFALEYYPGTSAPMDFISSITVKDGDQITGGEVSMNHIFNYRNYRFYQSTYDSDRKGTTLCVSYDPWGIAVTYTGYGLLLLTICLFFLDKQSQFRQLLRHPSLKSATFCMVFLFACTTVQAKEIPRALPPKTATAFGNLYIYYNDRVCPLQTLAKDFTAKLYGKTSYKGLTAEQVLTGWFFYYDDWKEEPCIRIKSHEVQQILGIEKEYACLTDFVGLEGYKLDEGMQNGKEVNDKRGVAEANEKFSLVSMVAAGSMWKIYPYITDSINADNKQHIIWYSLVDRLPYDMPEDLRLFVRSSMNYIAEQVAHGDFQEVNALLGKIRKFQIHEASDFLPTDARFKAEKWYNNLINSRLLAMISITLGILAFIFYCWQMINKKKTHAEVTILLLSLLGGLFLYLCLTITLRGIVSGHIPMANGHETMQLMAACTAFLTFIFYRRIPITISFGFLLCGLALLVSMLGEANPQITQLMPVLQSPLLSIHVVVIMIAYSLLAFVMLNGVTAVILHKSQKNCGQQIERLQVISQIILYPAVFLLTIGIFIGAVWANVSWGRYWGWDPKEVWALITMLVYALALHPASLPWFRRPMFFHIFCIAAFLTVLITYFGVNFLLGGMHSYANG